MTEKPFASPEYNVISNAAFSSQDVYVGYKARERGGNRERVCIPCGGHYFWCAPRLGELENIILSG